MRHLNANQWPLKQHLSRSILNIQKITVLPPTLSPSLHFQLSQHQLSRRILVQVRLEICPLTKTIAPQFAENSQLQVDSVFQLLLKIVDFVIQVTLTAHELQDSIGVPRHPTLGQRLDEFLLRDRA
jgi:hypothetical protein